MKKKSRIKKGRQIELLFDVQALEEGLFPYKPVDTGGIDRIVLNEKKEVFKVQIKSHWQGNQPQVQLMKNPRKIEYYTQDDIDVLAAYWVYKKAWYIIPFTEIGVGSVWLPRQQSHREAWHVFDSSLKEKRKIRRLDNF